jgi:hypothetical protein
LFILPSFLVILFLGGFQWNGTVIIMVGAETSGCSACSYSDSKHEPRLKLGQAMRFFFVGMNLLVIAAFVLSLYGL